MDRKQNEAALVDHPRRRRCITGLPCCARIFQRAEVRPPLPIASSPHSIRSYGYLEAKPITVTYPPCRFQCYRDDL